MSDQGTNTPGVPGGMGSRGKIVVVIILAVAVGFVLWSKGERVDKEPTPVARAESNSVIPGSQPQQTTTKPAERATVNKHLPRLVDLGATKCIPCKKMAPILEELKKEFAGRLEVEFIDVWQKPEAGELYGVQLIPTQIFFDAGGKEQFRHQGFFSREDILAKWKELGLDLGATSGQPATRPT